MVNKKFDTMHTETNIRIRCWLVGGNGRFEVRLRGEGAHRGLVMQARAIRGETALRAIGPPASRFSAATRKGKPSFASRFE
jgi:hypothetical protein